MNSETKLQFEELLKENKLVLFMKGYKDQPMCGFSAKVVQILNHIGAEYETVNVLDDQDIREGIKEYGSWPTIPQLYKEGKLIGGCDIIIDLFQKDKLKEELGLI